MIKKIEVNVNGEWVEIALPEGAKQVHIEMEGVDVWVNPPDQYSCGRVFTAIDQRHFKNRYELPEVLMLNGEKTEDGEYWKWRSDALLYANGQKIVAKNTTNGSRYKETTIVNRPWKSGY